MINRPSYAQRTLELTRRSLEQLPTHLTPTISGVLTAPIGTTASLTATLAAPPHDQDTRTAPLARLVDLRRWRRKAATPVQRGARHGRTMPQHHGTTVR